MILLVVRSQNSEENKSVAILKGNVFLHQWFSNVSEPQNHLEDLLKHRSLYDHCVWAPLAEFLIQ